MMMHSEELEVNLRSVAGTVLNVFPSVLIRYGRPYFIYLLIVFCFIFEGAIDAPNSLFLSPSQVSSLV